MVHVVDDAAGELPEGAKALEPPELLACAGGSLRLGDIPNERGGAEAAPSTWPSGPRTGEM
jgi:hypothetical protein